MKKNLPGVWWNKPNFSFTKQIEIFGDELLNSDSIITTFGGIEKYDGERFIRPVDDGKAFSGEIVDWEHLSGWQDRINYLNSVQLPSFLPVQVSTVKNIFREYRFFVVNGKIITGSMYAECGNIIYKYLEPQDDIVLSYAQEMIDKWVPDRVCTIDIAVLNDEKTFKIIEFNNANAARLYKSDIKKLVNAINNMD